MPIGNESFDQNWYIMGVFLLNKLNVFLGIPVKVNIAPESTLDITGQVGQDLPERPVSLDSGTTKPGGWGGVISHHNTSTGYFLVALKGNSKSRQTQGRKRHM